MASIRINYQSLQNYSLSAALSESLAPFLWLFVFRLLGISRNCIIYNSLIVLLNKSGVVFNMLAQVLCQDLVNSGIDS